MINRIFHARVMIQAYMGFILFGFAIIYFYWYKMAILTLIFMVLLLLLIERTIKTTYTFTAEGNLEICKGKFYKTKVIPINAIFKTEKAYSWHIGLIKISHFLYLQYGVGSSISIWPENEDEFLRILAQRQEQSIY
jgi:hypothetical protein